MTAAQFNAAEVAAGRLTPAMLAAAEAAGGIETVQRNYGLHADGLAGAKTQAVLYALATGQTPVPTGEAGVRFVYGDIRVAELGKGRVKILDGWPAANIAGFKLHTGQKRDFHVLAGPSFVAAFAAACQASGYTPKSVQTWVPRHMNWSTSEPLSLHTWGIAVDFDPQRNAKGGRDLQAGGPSLMRQHPGFVDAMEAHGWAWGGRWSIRDDMHFARAYGYADKPVLLRLAESALPLLAVAALGWWLVRGA